MSFRVPSRKRNTRRRFRRRYRGAKSVARRALKEVRQIKKAVEFKYHTTGNTVFQPLAAGAIYPLSLIAEGDTVTSRDGRQIILKSINLKVFNTNATAEYLRFILFFDTQIAGTYPAVTDVLTTADYRSFKAFNGRKRYAIVWDKFYSTEKFNDLTGGMAQFYKKFNRKITYLSAAADEAGQGNGNLFLLVISQANGGVDTASYNCELRFQG